MRETNEEIIILQESKFPLKGLNEKQIKHYQFSPKYPWQFIQSLFYLATARTIFVDNYFGFLAATRFSKQVRCVQLWHAAGAFKRFGLVDQSNRLRSKRAIDRFEKVYRSFTHVVVGSDKMARLFQESFGTDTFEIVRTGIPRTDFFYNETEQLKARNDLKQKLHLPPGKKVILYAPTYRDGIFCINDIPLQINQLQQAFENDMILLLRLHPAVQNNIQLKESSFVQFVPNEIATNDILLCTDYLISDYSSIPFEFSLLEKPMIFFTYDLDAYRTTRGLQVNYEQMLPGPRAETTNEIIQFIQKDQFSLSHIRQFSKEWNTFSTGSSSKRLIKALYK